MLTIIELDHYKQKEVENVEVCLDFLLSKCRLTWVGTHYKPNRVAYIIKIIIASQMVLWADSRRNRTIRVVIRKLNIDRRDERAFCTESGRQEAGGEESHDDGMQRARENGEGRGDRVGKRVEQVVGDERDETVDGKKNALAENWRKHSRG